MTSHATDVHQYAMAHWPDLDWSAADVRVGAFHTVAVPSSGPILRLTTGYGFADRAEREAQTLRTLAGISLPVPLPRVLDGPIVSAQWSATLITRVPGSSAPDLHTATPRQIEGYRELLVAMRSVEHSALADLPEPRTWCGGAEWPTIVENDLASLLDTEDASAALERVGQLLDLEADGTGGLCHGDFGPHNILWGDDQPASIIDLDHACIGDPAIDIAPLIGFHGLRAVREIAPVDILRRALFHRATLSLQVAAAAHVHGHSDLRDHALGNFVGRNTSGTLFEPTGLTPETFQAALAAAPPMVQG